MKTSVPVFFLEKDALSQRLVGFDYTILAFGHWRQSQKGQTRDDVLSNFKVSILTNGRCRVSGGGMSYEAGKGDVFLFAPFVRNRVECLEGDMVGLYYLYFDLLPLQKRNDFLSLFHLGGIEYYPGRVGEKVLPQLERVERAVREGCPGCYFMAKLALERTLVDLLLAEQERGYQYLKSNTGAEEQVVGQCVEYLDAHVLACVQVSELCAALGLSQSYLCRCFKKALGRSTKEFIVLYRLKRAERELRAGCARIGELAIRYGFSSERAFSAAFKRYYGCSPSFYRKEQRE